MKKKSPDKKNVPPIFGELSKLCDSLLYISEIDAAVTPFFSPGEFPETFLMDQRTSSEAKIETGSIDDFFAKATSEKDWHNAKDKERVEKYRRLKTFMKANLRDLSLYRIGRIRIDIYVIGIDAEGNTAGIQTKAVET